MRKMTPCWHTKQNRWPITLAARHILDERFRQVRKTLSLAADHADEDVENVHRLRVATRRAIAAMRVFEDVLPKKRANLICNELRRLRRAAGNARDLDVIKQNLEADTQTPQKTKKTAFRRAAQQRKEAQKTIKRARKRWKKERLNRRIKHLVKHIRWRKSSNIPSFSTIAESKLDSAVEDFFSVCGDDLTEVCILHDLRIQGKHLRYVLEIASFLYEPTQLELLQNDLKELQDKLGKVMDHVAAKTKLAKWSAAAANKKQRKRLCNLLTQEGDQVQQSYEQFGNWLTHKRIKNLRSEFRRRTELESR